MAMAQVMTPLGAVWLAADEEGLCGLWFEGGRHAPRVLPGGRGGADAIEAARRWLAVYFSGRRPDFTPPLHLTGTAFQRAVWRRLLVIPYGTTATYGALAADLARERGLAQLSAQAVGGAVGRNPVSLVVPCHRVVGASGSLTGYAGGLERKAALLRLEGLDMARFHFPKPRKNKRAVP